MEVIVFIILALALCLGIYVFWLNLPWEIKSYKSFSANFSGTVAGSENINASNEIVQFYPNMRYKERSISYRLESACTQTKWTNIERAFSILSERTIISFYPSMESPEIRVLCSEVSPESDEKGHFIAGEGGPSEIINTTNFAVILSGKISLYKNEKCDEPKIAIHEILHALGFDHYNNSNSILYPITGCNQEIDSEIISDINRLYSYDSLPDLIIESIEANKSGRYLNFNINVSNEGLADSEGANLNIYVKNERIANFSLGNLEIGTKRMLYVKNVRMPIGSDNILLEVESEDAGELTLENNRVEMTAA